MPDDTQHRQRPLKPSQVSPGLGWFDRFASATSDTVARAWFFFACVLLIVLWAPTFIWFKVDTWQLIINTATTIITFLLVALLQNSQSRSDKAIQRKLNALSEGLIDVMQALERGDRENRRDISELRQSIGLEQREGT